MPVLAKFSGIVIRKLIDRTFGTRLHAIYGDSELVIGLNPVRVIQGDVPRWVQEWSINWVQTHEDELLPIWHYDPALAVPLARQSMWQLAPRGAAHAAVPPPFGIASRRTGSQIVGCQPRPGGNGRCGQHGHTLSPTGAGVDAGGPTQGRRSPALFRQ
jgi:hypothetical protein